MKLGVSERRACRVLGQARSTQRHSVEVRGDEDALTRRIVQMASCYGRYGYRRIAALLCHEGWRVNHKRVERIWRREGLKVPRKQPRRGRLWLADGSCIRLRPTNRDHVWSYDFLFDRTRDGRGVKIMTVIDEYTRECLALRAARSLDSDDVLEVLDDLFIRRGIPGHIRSANGPEFMAEVIRAWRQDYNTERPHGSLNGLTPQEYLVAHGGAGGQRMVQTMQHEPEPAQTTHMEGD